MDMQDDWLSALRTWASENNSVCELWLFGSRATGCSQPDSDVDLAVSLTPGVLTMITYNDSFDEWKNELRAIVGRDVSLVPVGRGFELDSEVRSTGVLLWARK